MSLSTRALAGIGAVVVIGLGTLGGSIAYANSKGKPDENQATLVVGRSSIESVPLCYNGGNPLGQDDITNCQNKIKDARSGHTLKSSDVRSGDKVGVGIDKDIAAKGWYAYTDGGQQGQAPITQDLKGPSFSGLVPASSVLNASGTTMVTVVSSNSKTNEIFGVWAFQLNTKD